MKRRLFLAVATVVLGFGSVTARAQTYIWTGIGNGWLNQSVPLGTGGEDLIFGDSVRPNVTVNGNWSIDTLFFEEDDAFLFVPGAASNTLTLTGGFASVSGAGFRADFDKNLTLNLTGAQIWDLQGQFSTVTLHGKLTGTGSLTLNGINQTLLLSNLTANPSDYTGTITLNQASTAAIGTSSNLVLWGAGSIGTGAVVYGNGGNLITHGAPTLGNNFTFNSGPLLSGQAAYAPITFRNWDSPGTTLTGAITLANHTTLFATSGFANKLSADYPNNTGNRPLPGPITRHPLLISGNIGESGGSRRLNITGPGLIILSGTNTYTGGTSVGFSPNLTSGVNQNANGSLVFATQSAIPTTGTILSGQTNLSGAAGYIGIATSAVPNAGDFATFLTKIAPTSSGAVGLDSLTAGLPSGSPSLFAENINLTGFTTTAFEGIRLGTATSLTLTGTITPQLAANYNFGNGGGKLYVQSSLGNHTTSTYLAANNTGVALMLYLQGANTYNGGTYANNGFIIFDGASAIPASGILRAGGSAANIGASYLGFTNTTLGGTAVNGATLTSGLLTRFDKANTWGIVGFDSNIPGTPTTVTNLDLTGFNDGVFVGTTSEAVLSGTITPTSVATANAANTYRFTAADGGKLVVDSALTDGASARSVVIGISTTSAFQKLGDGTVVLNGPNTYTGGTTINTRGGITLSGAADTSFGTGAITLGTVGGGIIGLSAANPGRNFNNDIVFAQAAAGTGFTPQFMLTGANDFTLSGDISGPPLSNAQSDLNPNGTGVGLIGLANSTPINVTLTGDNSGYYGQWQVQNGTLSFGSANAVGHGTLQLDSDLATVAFTTSSTLYGLTGINGGHLHLANGINLTVDTSNQDGDFEFSGAISAPGNLSTSASLTVTATPGGEILYLSGHNQYSGGTTITGSGTLGLGAADSAGSGTVTVNALDGGLVLNSGAVFTNALVLTQGGLAGLGNFSPASVNGVAGAPITIGANQLVYPGIPGDRFITGKLTFDTSAVFSNGGTYIWGLQDAVSAGGSSHLFVLGNLDLTSISTSSFNLLLETYDDNGELGLNPSLVMGTAYQFVLVETGGTISGFDAGKFVFDVADFQNGIMPASAFSVTADSTHLYLNFTAVPEPSTYALLALGSGWVIATLRRRRRT